MDQDTLQVTDCAGDEQTEQVATAAVETGGLPAEVVALMPEGQSDASIDDAGNGKHPDDEVFGLETLAEGALEGAADVLCEGPSEGQPAEGDETDVYRLDVFGAEGIEPSYADGQVETETPVGEAAGAEALSADQPLTLEAVRALVLDEISHTQTDLMRMVQSELVRQQQDRRRASLSAIEQVVDNIYDVKAESIRVELEALREQEQVTLKNYDMPLRERMEEVDFIRARIAKAGQEIIEVEANAKRRVAESAHALAELEGRAIVVELLQQVEQQKGLVASMEARLGQVGAEIEAGVKQGVATTLATMPKAGRLGLWQTVAILVVVLLVGVAGIILPWLRLSELSTQANTRFLVETATLYQATGAKEDALRILDEAVQAGIEDAETLGRVGEMYRVLKETQSAVDLLSRAVKKDPNNRNYLLSLARSYASLGRHEEAIAHYEKLCDVDPKGRLTYYTEIGHRYRSMKSYDLALAQYQKTLEINGKYWQAYYFQGEIYREQKLYDEAIACYKKTLDIKPDYYVAMVNTGVSYAGKGDWTRAIEAYRAANGLAPDRSEAYFYIGEAYLAQGHFSQAVEPYQQAIAKNEKYTTAYLGLGKVYVALNDCTNATLQFMQVLKLSPKHAEAEEGLKACRK